MPRIVISDAWWDVHGTYIKQAIQLAYPELVDDDFIIVSNINQAINYAVDNEDVIAIIESTTGGSSYFIAMQQLYENLNKRVLFFAPLGGNVNLFEEVFIYSENAPKVIVTSGAGDEELRNNTSYGKGLEFWDWDLTQTFPIPTSDQSSYSNGIVLGKLLKIKDELNCSWWEARFRARVTADRTEPNRNDIDAIEGVSWCKFNGFGRINVDNAIGYSGIIPPDPYRIKIGDVGRLHFDIVDDFIIANYDPVLNADGYELQFFNDNSQWESIEYGVEWKRLGEHFFRYRAYRLPDDDGGIQYTNWYSDSLDVKMDVGNINFERLGYDSHKLILDNIQYADGYIIKKDEIAVQVIGDYIESNTCNKTFSYQYKGFHSVKEDFASTDFNNISVTWNNGNLKRWNVIRDYKIYSDYSNTFRIKGYPKFKKIIIKVK